MTIPMSGVFGLGAAELIILMAILLMLAMVAVGGAVIAFLLIRTRGARSRPAPVTTSQPPTGGG